MTALETDTAAPARTPKSARRREAILRTATEVINARGFAQATMKEIAARLGLRDAALYYYFADKEALGHACLLDSLVRVEAAIDGADRAGATGLDKVERFIAGMIEDAARHGSQAYLGDLSWLGDGRRAEVAAWTDRLAGKVQRFLEEGMADGTVVRCEPELVVQLLLGMLIWLAKWTPGVDGLTAERLIAAIRAFSFHGVESRT